MCSTTGSPIVFPVLDTGAGGSYVSSKLIESIGVRPIRRKSRKIEMLLHTSFRKIEVYTVKISNTAGDFEIEAEVSKVDKGELLRIINPEYKEMIEQYNHLKGIEMEDDDEKPELPIHVVY